MLGPAVLSSPARETFIGMHAHESSRPSPLRYNAHVGTRRAHLPVRSSAAWIHPRGLTLFFSANLQARSRTQLRFSSSILTLTSPRPLQIAPVRAVDIPTLVRSRLSASRLSAPALSPILSTCQSELPGGQWRTVGQLPSLLLAKPSEPGVPSLSVWLLARPNTSNLFFLFSLFVAQLLPHPSPRRPSGPGTRVKDLSLSTGSEAGFGHSMVHVPPASPSPFRSTSPIRSLCLLLPSPTAVPSVPMPT